MPERNNYLAANCCSHYSRNTDPQCLFPTLEEGTKRDSMTIDHFWGIAGFSLHVSAREATPLCNRSEAEKAGARNVQAF